MRDIFPEVRKGSFTWHEGMQKWVWTTFNSFQWDINYSNPAVFRAMAEEMLFLANTGIEILRLDAVPFMWKRMGTNCENQPEVHTILQAFNAVARIAAPSLLFKSEAIVHPNEVIKYISSQECQLSYNPMLMALLWESLATREIRLLAHAMNKRNRTPKHCTWVNYLRCHDDIGWTFDDQDALELGINPKEHRKFLNDFYTGKFPGSFARGGPFQFNPETGDLRVAGTLASLAGLEQAIYSKNSLLIDMAIRRISMLFSTILSIGGIPLIYLGEEWGLLNDYSYINDIKKSKDSRWIHRYKTHWEKIKQWNEPEAIEKRIFSHLAYLIKLRKEIPALQNGDMEVVNLDNPHLFGYIRQHDGQRILIISNFAEQPQVISPNNIRLYGMSYQFIDRITSNILNAEEPLKLEAYGFIWIENINSK